MKKPILVRCEFQIFYKCTWNVIFTPSNEGGYIVSVTQYGRDVSVCHKNSWADVNAVKTQAIAYVKYYSKD